MLHEPVVFKEGKNIYGGHILGFVYDSYTLNTYAIIKTEEKYPGSRFIEKRLSEIHSLI